MWLVAKETARKREKGVLVLNDRFCEACGAGIGQSRGRPRRWCSSCSPAVSVAGRAGAAAAWRALNPERVAAHNSDRRMTDEEWNGRGRRLVVDDETLAKVRFDGSADTR